jgi:hypothetical protein
VRVVPIGKLFEKNTVGRRGNVAPPNVHYWVNSGRHLLDSSSSDFDPTETSLGAAAKLDTLPSYSVALLAGPKEEFDRYQNDPNEKAVGSKPLTRRRSK